VVPSAFVPSAFVFSPVLLLLLPVALALALR
jgi:hypothetical protein